MLSGLLRHHRQQSHRNYDERPHRLSSVYPVVLLFQCRPTSWLVLAWDLPVFHPSEVFVAARLTRKEMKTDKFAMEVGQTVDYVAHHRRQLLIYGSIAVAVAAIGFGVYWYLGHQQTVRAQALAYAILIQESPVGPASPTAPMAFATDDAKRAAATKQFSEVAGKYPGTNEGAVAKYYLGAIAADQGKMADAEKFCKEAADAGDRNYSSLARFSLSDVYFGEKKNAEAEKILRDMMDHPT